MALKKGERVQVMTREGYVAGFVYKAGAKVTMIADDGRRTYKAEERHFKPTAQPIPADSPFANPILEKGARVTIEHEGRIIEGVVKSADIFQATVLSSSAEYTVAQGIMKPSDVEVPVDPATPMDAWSVRKYKPVRSLSEETTAFTAEIWLDGRKVLDAKNDGHGGCNIYYGPYDVQQRFQEDAKAWAIACGDPNPFEPEDSWVSWAGEEKPYGLTATEHFTNFRNAYPELNNPAPGR